jgi:gluconate 5-dehydrogenase
MNDETPVSELFDLTGRVAIVTGAPGQLGEAMAETLAELGSHIVVVSRTESDCERLASRLTDQYQRAVSVPADVTDPAEVEALAASVRDEFGRLDVLVNNAYAGTVADFEEMSVEQFRDGIDAALTSVFLTTRETLPLLRDGGASIINVASIYGIVAPNHGIYGDTGLNNPVQYGAAKAGVIQLSRWLATRYADAGIRANALTPGGIYNPDLESREGYEETFVPNYEELTPLGRMGRPQDLKGATAFLASDASSWVTGQNLVVDGGWTTW